MLPYISLCKTYFANTTLRCYDHQHSFHHSEGKVYTKISSVNYFTLFRKYTSIGIIKPAYPDSSTLYGGSLHTALKKITKQFRIEHAHPGGIGIIGYNTSKLLCKRSKLA